MPAISIEKNVDQNEVLGNRVLFPDILRILAIFAVILAHISAAGFVYYPVSYFGWHVSNIYGCLARWSIPLFVMISGMFFLNPQKKISLSKLYCKNTLRLVVALIFWGVLYRSISIVKMIVYDKVDLWTVVEKMANEYSKLIFGPIWYHLWFLYMIIGLYILVPLLRVFTQNATKEHYYYLFLIYMLFGSALPLVNESLVFVDSPLDINFKIVELMGYSCFFILGYYLSKYDITDKIKKWIYVISIVSFFIQVFATSFISSKVGIAQQFLYEASRPNVVIQAVAIFLFVKDLPLKINFSDRSKTIIGTVSKYSFGMYLVHDFFNLFFTKIGFTVMCMNPVVSILLRTIVTFILSFVVVWILDKIPLIRKHCI